MSIPLQQARKIFTEETVAVYRENAPVPSFLRNMFTERTTTSKIVNIEVQRDTEYIAVDVNRGGGGKRNTFSKSTLKEFMPPYFEENFDATSMDRYDIAFGQGEISARTIGLAAREVGMKLIKLQDKIERAKEKMCAEVLETGVVTLTKGVNIDFKRKAESLVDPGAGNYWTTTDAPVEAQIVAAGTFIRNKGKNAVKELDMILSSASWIALKETTYFKDTANFNAVQLIAVNRPIADAFGATMHGQIDAGQFKVNVFVYDEVYDTEAAAANRYLSEDVTIFLPVTGHQLVMAHGGVPAIIRDVQNAEFPEWIMNMEGAYWVNNYIDPRGKAHIFEIMSAPVPIPVTVDMIYTLTTLGGGGEQG